MKTILTVASLCVVALLLAVGTGCEVESASQAEITITPSHVVVHKGQSVEFTASGWHEYNWAIANAEWGVISHRVGATTVYTAIVETNGIQTLVVSATVTGTNITSSISGSAQIEHQ